MHISHQIAGSAHCGTPIAPALRVLAWAVDSSRLQNEGSRRVEMSRAIRGPVSEMKSVETECSPQPSVSGPP